MTKIALVVAYFGKLPNYFPLWLKSCGGNPGIDFLVFTNDQTAYHFPENVKRKLISWKRMQERVRACFDFEAYIDRPYKLCDYKPAYGEIFAPELKEYDFWGNCDIDLVWGALHEHLTEELLGKYDHLFHLGHCSLYRNTPEINRLYRSKLDGKERYREVYQNPANCLFDEWGGMAQICDSRGIPVYEPPGAFADIDTDRYHFVVYGDTVDKERPQFFLWQLRDRQSRVFRYYKDGHDVVRQEYLYIHLQKRDMKPAEDYGNSCLIVPNRFIPCYDDMLDQAEDVDIMALIKKYHQKRLLKWPVYQRTVRRWVRKARAYLKKE